MDTSLDSQIPSSGQQVDPFPHTGQLVGGVGGSSGVGGEWTCWKLLCKDGSCSANSESALTTARTTGVVVRASHSVESAMLRIEQCTAFSENRSLNRPTASKQHKKCSCVSLCVFRE